MPKQAQEDAIFRERSQPWVQFCRVLWKIIAFLGTTIILGTAASLLAAWLTSPNGAIPANTPLRQLFSFWPITLPLGGCFLLLALLTWILSRWPPQPTITPSLVQQDRAHMIGRLRRTYSDLLAQTLQGIAWMDINLSEKPDAVRNAATLLLRSVNQPERLLPIGTSILDAYDQAEQDLLILGAPGSGKSTLLLNLAQQLVERAAQDAGHAFPVILPLSSWAVKRPPLQDWIIEQLTQIYDIPRRVSEQWIRENAILPLLDGLDEMDESARPACINAINIYHQIHMGTPLVVCSRKAEYDVAAQSQRLALQHAVIAQPLTPQQVNASLIQAGETVAALRSAMKKNSALQELATTPLMLSVLMLTYQGTMVRELPRKEALLQQQVWTDYVARMVQQKGNENRYPLKRTCHWLTWLAQQMRDHQQTIFYAEYLHPGWLRSEQQSVVEWLTIRVPALVLGVLVGLIVSLFVSGLYYLAFLLQIGLLGGFVGGSLSWKAEARTAPNESSLSTPKRVDWLSCLLLGIFVAESLGLYLGKPIYPNISYSLRDWLRDGSILGVGSGLSAWAFQIFLFRTPQQRFPIPFTRSLLRWPITARLTTIASQSVIWQAAIVLGIGMGLTYGLDYVLSDGLNSGLSIQYDISGGLSNGMSLSLVVVLTSYILDTSLKPLRFAERVHWTWRSLRQPEHLRISVIVTGLIFLLFGLDYWLGLGLSLGLSNGLSIGLSAGLGYWLLVGLYQGMVQEHVKDQDRRQFNQGIRRSFRNGTLISLLSAGIIASIGVLIGELSAWLFQTLGDYLSNVLGFMPINRPSVMLDSMLSLVTVNGLTSTLSRIQSLVPHSGPEPSITLGIELSYDPGVVWLLLIGGFLLMWAMSGGLTILRHYIIRWLLVRSNCFPWSAQAFLDDATSRILLQRVGGGYRFMHRLLLDYFADLDTESSPLTSTSSPNPSNAQA